MYLWCCVHNSSEVLSVWYGQSFLTPDGRTQLWKKCKRQGCYADSASNPGSSPLALDKSTVTNSGEEKKKKTMLKPGYCNSMDAVTFPGLSAKCAMICSLVSECLVFTYQHGGTKSMLCLRLSQYRSRGRWDKHLCHFSLLIDMTTMYIQFLLKLVSLTGNEFLCVNSRSTYDT